MLLRITRPAKVMKSTVIVSDGNDQEIGRIVQDNVFGKIHFSLQAGGHTYGAIKAENWRAWNFRIEDHTGAEVARITKTFEGIAKTMFTTADNYVVQIHGPIPQPLNSLVVASALSVDTALKQDSPRLRLTVSRRRSRRPPPVPVRTSTRRPPRRPNGPERRPHW